MAAVYAWKIDTDKYAYIWDVNKDEGGYFGSDYSESDYAILKKKVEDDLSKDSTKYSDAFEKMVAKIHATPEYAKIDLGMWNLYFDVKYECETGCKGADGAPAVINNVTVTMTNEKKGHANVYTAGGINAYNIDFYIPLCGYTSQSLTIDNNKRTIELTDYITQKDLDDAIRKAMGDVTSTIVPGLSLNSSAVKAYIDGTRYPAQIIATTKVFSGNTYVEDDGMGPSKYGSLTYSIDGGKTQTYTGPIDAYKISSSVTVTFILDGTSAKDTETIPVLYDGSDAIVIDLDNDAGAAYLDPDNVTLDSYEYETNIFVYKGLNQVSLKSISYDIPAEIDGAVDVTTSLSTDKLSGKAIITIAKGKVVPISGGTRAIMLKVTTEDNIQYSKGFLLFFSKQGQPGEQGITPETQLTSIIFKRSNLLLNSDNYNKEVQKLIDISPNITTGMKNFGGNYADPNPSTNIEWPASDGTWTDSIPNGTAILWMSTRTFSTDDDITKTTVWSKPARATDSDTIDYEWLPNRIVDGKETHYENMTTEEIKQMLPLKTTPDDTGHESPDNNNGWYDEPVDDAIWMAQCEVIGGQYVLNKANKPNWKLMKVKGEQGDDGTSIDIRGGKTGKELYEMQTTYPEARFVGESYTCSESGQGFEAGHLYIWDGDSFEDGGQFNGKDGESAYVHIKYADKVGSTTPSAWQITEGQWKGDWIKWTEGDGEQPGSYTGLMTDNVKGDPTVTDDLYSAFTWTYTRGQDGWGFEYIYTLTGADDVDAKGNPIPPETPKSGNTYWIGESKRTQMWNTFSPDYQKNDFIPDGWTDNPQAVTPDNPYCWVVYRQYKDGVWQPYYGSSSTNGKFAASWVRYAFDGLSPEFTSIIFKRSNGLLNDEKRQSETNYLKGISFDDDSDIEVLKKNGGSYTNPNPALDNNYPTPGAWVDSIPSGDEVLWMSTRIFYADDKKTYRDGVSYWSEPKRATDSENIDYEWLPNTKGTDYENMTAEEIRKNPGLPTALQPSDYTGPDEHGWYDEPVDNAIWMASREVVGGKYIEGSEWKLSKIKGEKGDGGDSLIFGDAWDVKKFSEMSNQYKACLIINEAHKSVEDGDFYMDLETKQVFLEKGHLYVWDGDSWTDCGKIDGESAYMHKKYAKTTENGHEIYYLGGKYYITFTDGTGEDNSSAEWLGTYCDQIKEDSDDYNAYTWTYIKGQDGYGVEMIYKLTATNEAPSVITEGTGYTVAGTHKTEKWSIKHSDYQLSDFVPDGWTDDAGIPTSATPYCWVLSRKFSPDALGNSTWGPFIGSDGKALLYTKYAFDAVMAAFNIEPDSIWVTTDEAKNTTYSNSSINVTAYTVSTEYKAGGSDIAVKYSVDDGTPQDLSIDSSTGKGKIEKIGEKIYPKKGIKFILYKGGNKVNEDCCEIVEKDCLFADIISGGNGFTIALDSANTPKGDTSWTGTLQLTFNGTPCKITSCTISAPASGIKPSDYFTIENIGKTAIVVNFHLDTGALASGFAGVWTFTLTTDDSGVIGSKTATTTLNISTTKDGSDAAQINTQTIYYSKKLSRDEYNILKGKTITEADINKISNISWTTVEPTGSKAGSYVVKRVETTFVNNQLPAKNTYEVYALPYNGATASPYRGVFKEKPTETEKTNGVKEYVNNFFYGNQRRTDIIKFIDSKGDYKFYIAQPDAPNTNNDGAFVGNTNNTPEKDTGLYWADFGKSYDSVATEFLFANTAEIVNLTVRKLETADKGEDRIIAEKNILQYLTKDDVESLRITGDEIKDFSNPTDVEINYLGPVSIPLSKEWGKGSRIDMIKKTHTDGNRYGLPFATFTYSSKTPITTTFNVGFTCDVTLWQAKNVYYREGGAEGFTYGDWELIARSQDVEIEYEEKIGTIGEVTGKFSSHETVDNVYCSDTPKIRTTSVGEGTTLHLPAGENITIELCFGLSELGGRGHDWWVPDTFIPASYTGDFVHVQCDAYPGPEKLTLAEAANSVQMGNNGFRTVLGTTTDYFEAIKIDNHARITMRSGQYGLRVSNNGIQKLSNGKWVDASL